MQRAIIFVKIKQTEYGNKNKTSEQGYTGIRQKDGQRGNQQAKQQRQQSV